jgi:hypothetical protein
MELTRNYEYQRNLIYIAKFRELSVNSGKKENSRPFI